MSSVITAHDLSWEFSNGNLLFSHLNFSIPTGLTALVGPNGVGKSTLAYLLTGKLEPTSGVIQTQGAIHLFSQTETPPNTTILEYLDSDYSWSHLGEQLLGSLDLSKLCNQLSGGEWMRVRLAKVVQYPFLILDEPTNNLDREGRNILIHFLKTFNGSALLISHDRECLSICQNILELSNQGISKYGDGWKNYEATRDLERKNLARSLDIAERQKNLALQQRQQENLKQEKRNNQGKQQGLKGGTPKILLGRMKRKAEATSGKINENTLKKIDESMASAKLALDQIKVDPVMYAELLEKTIPQQKLVAEAINFNVKFSDAGNWIYKKDLNFCWRGPIRLSLKGKNGSGKSTLIKCILNATEFYRGQLHTGQLQTLYIDQKYSTLNSELSVFDNIRLSAHLTDTDIRNGLAKFLFTKDSVFQKVESLSGGEKLRASLALGLLQTEKPELLILDEPTNNLDLVNIQFLEKLIKEYKGALIIISHDEVFLDHCNITETIDLDNL